MSIVAAEAVRSASAVGFDAEPLSWCIPAIRASLAQSVQLLREALSAPRAERAAEPAVAPAAQPIAGDDGTINFEEPPAMAAPQRPVVHGAEAARLLHAARCALRTVQGALQMLSIEGATLLTREIELLIERMESGEAALDTKLVDAAARTGDALIEYLDELAAGTPCQPLRLYPYYRALLELRRAERVHPADLFFPDLSIATPDGPSPAERLRADTRLAARSRFEQGLLRFLRKSDDTGALDEMCAAVDMLEAGQRDTAQRTFWWLALAFFDAMRTRAITADLYAKRLIARLNTQMKHVLDHGTAVPQRLLIDTLFELARARQPQGLAAQAFERYGLAGVVPDDFELPRYANVDRAALREARDATTQAEQAWDRAARGSRADATAFGDAASALALACGRLPAPGLQRVATVLARTRSAIEAAGRIPEAASLEIATSLMFVEQVLERGARADDPYHSHGSEIAERLAAAFSGKPVPEALPSWMMQLATSAQRRLTMLTLVAEMQASLRSVEKSLDAFFRDSALRDGLAALGAPLKQVAGVLAMIEHSDASAGASAIAQAVTRLAADAQTPSNESECRRAAASLVALGFYIDSLPQPDRLAGRFVFDAHAGEFRLASHAPQAEPAPPQVELSVRAVEPLAAVAEPLARDVESLAFGAEPLTVPDLPAPSDLPAVQLSALEPPLPELPALDGSPVPTDMPGDPFVLPPIELEDVGAHRIDAIEPNIFDAEAIDMLDADPIEIETIPFELPELTPTAASSVVHVPFAEPAGASGGDTTAFDAELLQIFLGEADEVLATIEESIGQLRLDRFASNALGSLRRAFHTLKGSSRMVGLDAFGEAAWAMEQVLNRWLDESRGASAALDALVVRAHGQMGEWVAMLRRDATTELAPVGIIDAAHRLLDENLAALEGSVFEGLVPIAPTADTAQAAEHATSPVQQAPDDQALTVTDPMLDSINASSESVDAVEIVGIPAAAPIEAQQPDSVCDAQRASISATRAPLDRIFQGESTELFADLVAELDAWRSQPARRAGADAVRAAHSLIGSSALVGLTNVHELALSLEAFLRAHLASGSLPQPAAVDAFERAVERLRTMLQRFAAGDAPSDDAADIVRQLDAAAPQVPSSAADAGAGAHVADPQPQAPAHDTDGMTPAELQDELDAELLPIFLVEADEYLPAIGERLRLWASAPGQPALPAALMRDLHTVKGSARMAGAMRLGQIVHEMETRIAHASQLRAAPVELVDELLAEHDRVLAMHEALKSPSVAGTGLMPAHGAAGSAQPIGSTAPQTPLPASAVSTVPAMVSAASSLPAMPPGQALIRVRAELLDHMVNEAGEVSIARARLENEVGTIRQGLVDLTENVARLRSQLREIEIQAESQIQARTAQSRELHAEFDPLEFDRFTRFQELTRMLAESVNDVATVQQNMVRALEEATADLSRQAQVSRDLQQNLMRVRMVQFGTISDRLYRVVRRASKDVDRRVNLELRGAAAEIDRGILERMVGPIEHLLRNAVAHGIEPRAQRVAAGKPEAGEITVEVRQDRNEVVLVFSDDGRGLDLDGIRARALARGLIRPEQSMSDSQIVELIFLPGFTTADAVTATAGRGVGMDVVHAEVAALGGRIQTDTQAGRGTRFTIHLPQTLAINQVVLLTVGERKYAVPAVLIEQVLQLKPEMLADAYSQRAIDWQGARVPLYNLGGLLDLPMQAPVAQRQLPVLVLHSGNLRIALHVDHISANQEVVVKDGGPQLAQLAGVAGVTVLGNGEIVLIINPVQLAQTATVGADGVHPSQRGLQADQMAVKMQAAPTVMVVDDSLTVRKATQRLLSREGYEVLLAKDGVDALRQLQDTTPDVMLVDIEMPRMDGFDLTQNVRADARLREVPIVMITSRTADKHRNKAMALGVDVYLGKPYVEDELIGHVARLVAQRAGAAQAEASAAAQ